ncbi:Uncharacterised protein [Mycobacteroides abscessus subsp. abscessus]|nr:Uncharacterised protein [Mycobacteroides abscessus subsp. abscessus]
MCTTFLRQLQAQLEQPYQSVDQQLAGFAAGGHISVIPSHDGIGKVSALLPLLRC